MKEPIAPVAAAFDPLEQGIDRGMIAGPLRQKDGPHFGAHVLKPLESSFWLRVAPLRVVDQQ